MNCSITGLGTAVPPDRMLQDEVLNMSTQVICEDTRQERLMRTLFRRAGVASRHTALPWRFGFEWKQRSDPLKPGHGPRTAERMSLYSRFAGPLAVTSAKHALDDAQMRPGEITHLVTVSCTGFEAPGIDVRLIQLLGLRPTTQRIHVGFMGCHGAINGMRAVQGLVAANPKARVLLCAVELCSLHYRLRWDDEGIIGNALFADGAAALVATGDAGDQPAIWDIEGTGSCLIPESTDEMSWHIGDHGFEMRLTGQVPKSIERALRPWMAAWLDSLNCSQNEIGAWAVHPGGPRIIDAVESALNLTPAATSVSRDVLRTHGNMSSPTVLFILDRMRKSSTTGPIVTLAFGPGLMAEAAFLTPPQ